MAAVDILPRNGRFLVPPVEPRHTPVFVFALLTISSALASFALACATPFPAYAVIAAMMLPWRSALLVATAAWLVNQAIGFGALHYPIDGSTTAWGFVIGAAALAATAMAGVAVSALPQNRTPLVLALTLICAYATYEIVLFAATPLLGGAGSFSAAIVTRLALLNVIWLFSLVVVCEIVRLLNPFGRGRAVST